MKANVFRVLRKQGTSALVLSSRPPWSLRLSLPFPHPTFSSHDRLGAFFPFRHFSFTHALKLDDRPSQTTFEDPSRRGLFYHLVPPPTPLSDTRPVFAVSFLADPPPFSESTTILGWLPAETPGDDHEAGLNDFMENSRFLPLLHEAISQGLAEAVDDIQAAGALQLGEGWMHVHDDRNVPPLNRIGDPDDILASVRVEGGKILAETYQAMPSYRICTTHGITQLTEGLVLKLRRLLEAHAHDESRRLNA